MAGLWKMIGWFLSVTGILVQSGPPQIRVVTAIHIETTAEEFPESQIVTDPEMLKAFMYYLRKLDPYTAADIDPDSFRADSAYLTVEYSDGNSTQYTQLYTDYLKTDDGLWKKIDPEDGAGLWGILACISDTRGI